MSSVAQATFWWQYVNPNVLPNLSLWYNGSSSATTVNGVTTNNFNVSVVDGTSISAWNDISGGGHASNVNGGTGKQPNYATPIQNGLGALFYTSANSENLDINPIAWSQNLSGFSIYIVARPTSLPATQFPLVVTDTSLGVWWNGTNWSIGQSVGNRGTVTVTNDTTKFHIYGMIFDGTQTGNANRLKFRYDRVDQTLSFTGTIGTSTGTPTYMFFGGDNRGSVGAGNALSGTYMDGYIGEVIIFTRAINATEIVQTENYIKTKWNI